MKKGWFLGPTPGALEKEGTGSCPGIRTSNKVPRRFCCDECFFFFSLIFCLLIYFWLHWVFIAVRSLSLVVASGGYSLVVV